MDVVINEFREWYQTNAPEIYSEIIPGLPKEEIENGEKQLGQNLPEDYKMWLEVNNGAKEGNGIIGNWDIMDLSWTINEYKIMEEMVQNGSFGNVKAERNEYVKDTWWNTNWIPIVSSGSGHFFCIDNDPNANGKRGQIILFLHDDPERYLVADSFKSWIEKIVSDLKKGIYSYRRGYFRQEAFMKSSKEGKDIF